MLAIGTFLIVLGLGFVIYTNPAFFRVGKGTLAPWDPPKKLVVAGAYRYVRNPMISSVLMIVLGEALIFVSIELFILFILFFIVNHVYFVYSEEPELNGLVTITLCIKKCSKVDAPLKTLENEYNQGRLKFISC
ncbi:MULTISPECIES: methyltransferase family protein [Methanobacterium]|uniref:Methyltransferase n=1 Tax=Methanobacterium veterum TaxID=408577 RepID=A0A9E4ZZ22_9EURY|nr:MULTISPECIES: methyltransferase [Methanobacterium]MCZ3365969.1 methyltransferase [Methanobacterium veterum]MCZ3371434.1 methyltransferase [Methanobacterium veterum]